jgi:hypothetical protein
MFGFLRILWRRVTGASEPLPPDAHEQARLDAEARAFLRHLDLPFHLVGTVPVGGLRSMGFSEDGAYLLVVSEEGRTVIDPQSTAQVARDTMRYLVGQDRGEAAGIGPIRGQIVRVGGPYGGLLPMETPDGWGIYVENEDEPDPAVLVFAPLEEGFEGLDDEDEPQVWRLERAEGILAAGFSPDGRWLVTGRLDEVTIWGR